MNNSIVLQEGKMITHQVSYNDTGQRIPVFGDSSPRLPDSASGYGDVIQTRNQHPMSPNHRKSLTSLHHSETEVSILVYYSETCLIQQALGDRYFVVIRSVSE